MIVGGEYALAPSFPNPFHNRTQMNFALPEPSRVSLRIFDAQGRACQPGGRFEGFRGTLVVGRRSRACRERARAAVKAALASRPELQDAAGFGRRRIARHVGRGQARSGRQFLAWRKRVGLDHVGVIGFGDPGHRVQREPVTHGRVARH